MEKIKSSVSASVKRQMVDLADQKNMSVAAWIRYLIHQEIKKKGGAIIPSDKEIKDQKIYGLLSLEEKKAFYDKCEVEGLTANSVIVAMVRNYINQDPHFLKAEITEVRKASLELSAIGRNINQLVKNINKGLVNDVGGYIDIFHSCLEKTKSLKLKINGLVKKAKTRSVDND